MSVAAKIAGRQKNNTYYFTFPQEVEEQNYLMMRVKETTRESQTQQEKDTASRTFVFPIPSQLQTTSSMNYEQSGLGFLGATAAGRSNLQGAGTDVVNSVQQKIDDIVNIFGDAQTDDADRAELAQGQLATLGTVIGATYLGSKLSGNALGGAIAGIVTGNAISEGLLLGEKIAVNPHLAVLFKGVGLRQFGFQYKFVARNKTESDKLKQIIQALQYHMHPDYFVGNLAFQYPDEFEITFSKNRSSHLFNIKKSVLTSLTVNYNGEGIPIFFEDIGGPVSIDINMNFQETKILTKRDYAEDYEIERGRPPTESSRDAGRPGDLEGSGSLIFGSGSGGA